MEVKLKDIATVSSGKLLSRISTKYNGPKSQKEVLYHKGDEMYTELKEIADNIDESAFTKNGDIILKLSFPQKAIIIDDNSDIGEGVIISSKFVVINVTDENVNPEYLTYLLNSELLYNEMFKYNEGIIKQIKQRDLNELKLSFPEIDIQVAVVEYLKLLDKEIEYEKLLVEKNTSLKEAIIQKYSFKDEGEK